MTGFTTHRLRVHDTALPPYRRLSALRTCLVVRRSGLLRPLRAAGT
ncbi:hypothetical protein AB0M92_28225 [Streptomyces sp. NPDC051582]